MSEELKPCPFCDSRAEHYSFNCRKHTVRCSYCLADCGEHDTPERAAFVWNTRPAEYALTAEVGRLKAETDELRYIVEQFGMWYNEHGCPKRLNPDFPCSAEYEYKNDPETEGDFDERDYWKEAHEHGCWVEYYRWKYRQKNNNPDTEKGGEDE